MVDEDSLMCKSTKKDAEDADKANNICMLKCVENDGRIRKECRPKPNLGEKDLGEKNPLRILEDEKK